MIRIFFLLKEIDVRNSNVMILKEGTFGNFTAIPLAVFLFNQFNQVYQIRSKVTRKRLIGPWFKKHMKWETEAYLLSRAKIAERHKKQRLANCWLVPRVQVTN